MITNTKMCVTFEQALKFREFGVVQDISNFIWGVVKADTPDSGDNGYYHLLFYRKQQDQILYLCPEKDYGQDLHLEGNVQLEDYVAAYTADELATMLDMHMGDIEYDEGGELINQVTRQVVPYSDLVHAMADRILINLSIAESSRVTLNDLLLSSRRR